MADNETNTDPAPPASSPKTNPADRLILKALTTATQGVAITPDDQKTFSAPITTFFSAGLPPAPKAITPGEEGLPDICSSKDPNIAPVVAPFTAQLNYDLASAGSTFKTSVSLSRHNLQAALSQWEQANNQFTLSMAIADQAYNAALATAETAFNAKTNIDSTSRQWNLYYQMQKAVSAALLTREGALTDASTALGTAAGAAVNANLAYINGIGTAAAQRLSDRANAFANFWAAVEGALDAL